MSFNNTPRTNTMNVVDTAAFEICDDESWLGFAR
jgi:hypothetical protein